MGRRGSSLLSHAWLLRRRIRHRVGYVNANLPSAYLARLGKLRLGRSLGAAAGPDCASWVAAVGTKSEFVCLDDGVEVVDSGRAGARRRRREPRAAGFGGVRGAGRRPGARDAEAPGLEVGLAVRVAPVELLHRGKMTEKLSAARP